MHSISFTEYNYNFFKLDRLKSKLVHLFYCFFVAVVAVFDGCKWNIFEVNFYIRLQKLRKSKVVLTQLIFTCSKSTTETLEKGVKYVQTIGNFNKEILARNELHWFTPNWKIKNSKSNYPANMCLFKASNRNTRKRLWNMFKVNKKELQSDVSDVLNR